jgi:hypothetical protein
MLKKDETARHVVNVSVERLIFAGKPRLKLAAMRR